MNAGLLLIVLAVLVAGDAEPPRDVGEVEVTIPRPSKWVAVGIVPERDEVAGAGVAFKDSWMGVMVAFTREVDIPRAGGGRLRGTSTTTFCGRFEPAGSPPRLFIADRVEVPYRMVGSLLLLEVPRIVPIGGSGPTSLTLRRVK